MKGIERLEQMLGTKAGSFMPIPPPPPPQGMPPQGMPPQGMPPQGMPAPQDPAMMAQQQAAMAPPPPQPDPTQALMAQLEPVLGQMAQTLEQFGHALEVLKQQIDQNTGEDRRMREELQRLQIELEALKRAWDSAQDMPLGLALPGVSA